MKVLAMLVSVIVLTGNVMAMGTGIGPQVPGGSQSPTGPNDRATGNWGNQKKKDEAKKDDFQKAPLPPPVDVKQLDTARLEKAKDGLKLTDEESKKIDDVIKDLKDQAAKLSKDQDAARKSYETAATQTTANESAGKVVAVADQIRSFDPNRDLANRLQRILTADQWKIYIATKL